MDFSDINRQAELLKKFHLMDPKREIICSHKNCNVSAHMNSGKISFDPTLLNYFTDETILWLLLHEEGHLIYKQESEKRQGIKMKIWFVAMVVLILLQGFLFSIWRIPIQFFEISLIIDFIAITSLLFYIEKHWFPEPYFNDEYRADENAVKGLFIIRPDLISWQIMYSSFPAFKECSKITKRSYLRKLYLRFITKPHPPNILRVQKMRAIFNKYKQNKISNL
jgi:hypothetical protein